VRNSSRIVLRDAQFELGLDAGVNLFWMRQQWQDVNALEHGRFHRLMCFHFLMNF